MQAAGAPGNIERRTDVRFDANCPAIVELNFNDGRRYFALTGVLVNISESGCLVSSDNMPWKGRDAERLQTYVFETIRDKCRVYLPWSNTHCTGNIKRVGAFTLALEFDARLQDECVQRIAKLEPNRRLRFRPRNPWKYNRVLTRGAEPSEVNT